MKISIGRAGPTMDSKQGWTRSISPMNEGWSHTTQRKIDYFVSVQNRKHENALVVDGTGCFIFVKQRAGHTCSCQKQTFLDLTHTEQDIPNPLTSDNTAFHESNNAASMNLDRNNQPSRLRIFKARGFDPEATLEAIENNMFSPPSQDTSLQGLAKIKSDKYYRPVQQVRDEEAELERENAVSDILDLAETTSTNTLQDPQEAALQRQNDHAYMYGGEKTQCGICFGSGYVNGYALFGGQRFILESQSSDLILTNAEIDSDNAPYNFILTSQSNSSIGWNVVLPTYFISVPSIVVRHNIKPAVNYVLEIKFADSDDFVALTPIYLMTRNGMNNTCVIRVKCGSNQVQQELRFSHVELNIMLIDPPVTNFSTITKNIDFQNFDVLQTLSGLEISSSVPLLDRECVMVETKYNSVWNIIEVEEKKTGKGYAFNTTYGIRLIQNYETKFIFNSVLGVSLDLPYAGGAHQQRSTAHSYALRGPIE